MSHIVSLRSASLRALRSSATAATKCRASLPQQQYSYSTLPSTSTRILSTENKKYTKRVSENKISFHEGNLFNRQVRTEKITLSFIDTL